MKAKLSLVVTSVVLVDVLVVVDVHAPLVVLEVVLEVVLADAKVAVEDLVL